MFRIFVISFLSFVIGTLAGIIHATTGDRQEALANHAAYYDMQTGDFKFAVPPLVVETSKSSDFNIVLPTKHK